MQAIDARNRVRAGRDQNVAHAQIRIGGRSLRLARHHLERVIARERERAHQPAIQPARAAGDAEIGASDATVTIHSPEIREQSFTIKPGEVRRIRTGWRDASTAVVFDLKNGEGLRFDNLAYLPE